MRRIIILIISILGAVCLLAKIQHVVFPLATLSLFASSAYGQTEPIAWMRLGNENGVSNE
ncbi:hypothetical protein [Novipirellula artificiosorum]|uniref:Uncharacterized protein n=1 Tax=Novipirellula artificiosorum TaxID=2528016 RepID=A0A5C6DYM6_9BACT|nr:hypothetical protein [Novipirellula artificiosorum]TWU40937.1 hypothetical protein Poly41_17720 [Novipirellula artificiosorum]